MLLPNGEKTSKAVTNKKGFTMSSDLSNKKRVEIDLDYIMPETSFIYPLYSYDGEKLLDEREVLTQSKIKAIREKYGNKVYYSLSDSRDSKILPSIVYDKTLNRSKDFFDDIIFSGKFTKDSYKKSEEIIEDILKDLNSRELVAINLLKDMRNYDEYLYYHSVNVGLLSALLARKIRVYKGDEIKKVVLGAYLSDLGKIQIDKRIIDKPDRLSTEENIQIRLHPQLGYNMIKIIEGIDPIILQTVLFHHERFDDEGYYSLPYESLPTSPKIVAICDTYDALTSPKPYRQAYSSSEALKIILNSVDKQFDRHIVSTFINLMGTLLNNSMSFYKKGDFCILNTGELAIIRDINSIDLMSPKIIIFAKFEKSDSSTSIKFFQNPIEVDLMNDFNRKLSNIILHKKLIDLIRDKLKEKKLLSDYFYMSLPEWQ